MRDNAPGRQRPHVNRSGRGGSGLDGDGDRPGALGERDRLLDGACLLRRRQRRRGAHLERPDRRLERLVGQLSTPGFSSGACPTSNLCVTVKGQEIAATTDPGASAWTTQSTPDDPVGVSCASASLCVAVGEARALEVTTNPASGIWTTATIDGGLALSSIACR